MNTIARPCSDNNTRPGLNSSAQPPINTLAPSAMNTSTQPTMTGGTAPKRTASAPPKLEPGALSNDNTRPLITDRSLDQLENEIISLSKRINVCEYEFLVALREFDLRQGWKAYHFNNCAEWVHMKCGMNLRTAREKLRVANGLIDLPGISGAFQAGVLSYSKARSLTRAATPQTENQLLDFALKANADTVDRHCTRLRNAKPEVSRADANTVYSERFLSCTPDGDGGIYLTGRLPREVGELLGKALELAMSRTKSADDAWFEDGLGEAEVIEIDDNGPRGPSRLQQQQVDGLVEVLRAYLAGGEEQRSCTADHYQVTVHVDEQALRGEPGEESGSDLPIETVRRLCCDGSIVPLVEDDQGQPVGLGRKHRVVNPSLRRALLARDGGCRFPGCSHTKWLDAHHLVHWADGGETNAENLLLLCSTHHRLLHEGGFQIKPGPNGEWQFRNASGFR